ncbi:MAG TPA: N-acetyl-gamma-glutamyl-phosphate reductase [Gemmatimonadaceae bacterium]|nr:N-acetyl-gamma-glutamyl-phosphate reductase [Gemmatimonadaceae bacterium]
MHRIPVGVLGASGYAGRELCALIARHPRMRLAFATANERRGEQARLGGEDVRFIGHDDAPLSGAEIVFSALPHGASATWVARVRDAGARAIDLSSDLRPGNGAGEDVPYGLTELARRQLADAAIVANPGCYPTAILMALLPLAKRGLIASGGTVNATAASGVTGAGLTARTDLLFGEVTEDFRAYGIANTHRHLAEMRTVLDGAGADADLIFTPHLLPVARGILATITVPVTERIADPLSPWRDDFAGEPFVEVTAEPPSLRDVVRRNVVRISARHIAGVRQPTLLILSAIDNLVKGAAGQAVQNANVVLGLDEPMGLPT